MIKIISLIVALLYAVPLFSQNLTASQLLQKSIDYHDPGGKWNTFKGGLHLKETRPDGPDRRTHLHINNKKSFFELIQHKEGNELVHVFENGNCIHLLNKSKNISDADRKKHKLNSERTQLLRDYYLYLWGLPMKLTDPGTKIHEEVIEMDILGEPALALKVTYDENVGDDTWYFYFNTINYSLMAYRFYHDESKNDGEYILCPDQKNIKGINFPASLKWYYNKDDKFLGEDILETQ
ncbi:MAG: DUF6503 family protein [Bacteroidota bacterium]